MLSFPVVLVVPRLGRYDQTLTALRCARLLDGFYLHGGSTSNVRRAGLSESRELFVSNSRQRRRRVRASEAALPPRVLNRFRWFRWLMVRRPEFIKRFSGWGGMLIAAGIIKQGLDWEINGAIKTAAVAFIAAWFIALFAFYISDYWDKHAFKGSVLMMVVVIGLCFLWWAYLPPPAIQQTQIEDRRIDKITELLEKNLENKDRYQPDALLKRYPRGYVIYELNYSNQVFPYDKRLLEGFNIDWSRTGIVGVTDDLITVQLPYMNNPERRMTFQNMLASVHRRVGATTATIQVDDVIQVVELVAIREKGFVFLIGFKDAPGTEKVLWPNLTFGAETQFASKGLRLPKSGSASLSPSC